MPNLFDQRHLVKNIFILVIIELILLNLAWNHSYLGEVMIPVKNYYQFNELPIFQYRALPSFIYCILSFGCRVTELNLNKPFNSTATIFQIMWDFGSLNLALLSVVRMFFDRHVASNRPAALMISAFIVIWLYAFSFIFVPNRAFFYPYDFSDFAFLLMLGSLVISHNRPADWVMAMIMFLGAFNKETVLIFPAVYFILKVQELGAIRAGRGALILGLAGLFGKYTAIQFVNSMMIDSSDDGLVANQLHENLSQLLNPLFYVAIAGAFSYLYVPIILLRKHLTRIDWMLLCLSGIIFLVLFRAGISRELRIYIPVTTLFLMIIARHRSVVSDMIKDQFRRP